MAKLRVIAVWTIQVLLSALFALQGLMKLSGSTAWINRFRAWGYPEHFYIAVGIAELIGAIGLLIPRFARLGAALLMLVMAGAAVTHAIYRERQLLTTIILFILLSTVFYVRRTNHRPPERT